MNVLTHLAIIPDGNRRWAKLQSGLYPWDGHRKGAEQFKIISRAAFRNGVSFVTVWAASEDNLLKREEIEVSWLVKIFVDYLQDKKVLAEMEEDGVRFRVFGRGQEIVKNIKLDKAISHLETATASCARRNLTILFGYDGRREMVDAMRKISEANLSTIEYRDVKSRLWTRDLPPVDLVIRTGEEDIDWAHWSSGFMMWDTANAEFYFTKTFWPAFSEEELARALAGYRKRRQAGGA